MGNNIHATITFLDQEENTQKLSKLSTFIRSILAKKTKQQHKQSIQKDDFFIKYSHQKTLQIDIESIDKKRVVFVSLIGAFKTWTNCPNITLYAAFFLMPLKQKWVYYPSKYINEIQSSLIYPIITNIFSNINITKIKQFLELLRWKDSQQLVCWMLDDYVAYKPHAGNENISPVWCDLNNKLTSLYDPLTSRKYKSLIFDESWWKSKKKFKSKYDNKISCILREFASVTMKYNTMKEIIYQSNPDSLRPVTLYNLPSSKSCKLIPVKSNREMFNLYATVVSDYNVNINDNDKGDWFIAQDYDPYDI